MRIDIHTHTKKVKQGDSEHRNVDVDRFEEIIKETDVKVLAITNHNHFDHEQYSQFKSRVDEVCQIWPGVEFDVQEQGRRAHLIILVNPKNSQAFSEKVNEVLGGTSPDSFTITIDDIVGHFEDLDSIFIAHYHSKKPNLLDEDLDKLISLVSNSKRILKEASNSISAGIYINHGHNSIHGSDVQNWNDYVSNHKDLPELRLPVESFEQFCLLLDKDDNTINTILHKKTKESIRVNPFSTSDPLNIDIYNDINIFFGSKGTGKTEILKALSTYYNGRGFNTEVYESNSKKLDEVYDLKGNLFDIDINDIEIDDCSNEIASLVSATEKGITSMSKYLLYYSTDATNKISREIKVDKFTPLDPNASKRSFEDVKKDLDEFRKFKEYYDNDGKLKELIGDELLEELDSILIRIIAKIGSESEHDLLTTKA